MKHLRKLIALYGRSRCFSLPLNNQACMNGREQSTKAEVKENKDYGFTKNTLKDQYNEYIKSFIRWEVKNFAWLAVNHMRPSINSTIQSINQSINQSVNQSKIYSYFKHKYRYSISCFNFLSYNKNSSWN